MEELQGSIIDGSEIRLEYSHPKKTEGPRGSAENKTLIVRNLSYDTTVDRLKETFGDAVDARVPTFPDTGNPRG